MGAHRARVAVGPGGDSSGNSVQSSVRCTRASCRGRCGAEAFRVVPSVKKLTDTEGEKKFRSATLWIAADETREVLKMESEVWIGSVTAKLQRFNPHADFGTPDKLPKIFQASLEGRSKV